MNAFNPWYFLRAVTFGAVVLVSATACSPVKFACGTGEYGPRALVVGVDLTAETLENLSRLCSSEVEQ
jgi:hypothetical protein